MSISPTTGDYSGTAPDSDQSHRFEAQVTDANDDKATDVFFVSVRGLLDEPPTVTCANFDVTARPGASFTQDRVCASEFALSLEEDSAPAVVWPNTGFEIIQEVTLARRRASGVGIRFSGSVPAGTAAGDYQFEAAVRSTGSTRTTRVLATVTVPAADVPKELAISADQLAIRGDATQGYSAQFTATGGTGAKTYAKRSGPSDLTISPTGAVSIPMRTSALDGSFVVRVTDSATPAKVKDFNGTVALRVRLAPGGGEDEDLI